MIQSTELQSESVTRWGDHQHDETKYLAASDAVQSGDTDRVRSTFIAEQEGTDSAVTAIHYVSATDSEVLASTVSEAEGTTLADAPWTTADVSGNEPVLLEPVETQTSDAPVTGFVTEAAGDD